MWSWPAHFIVVVTKFDKKMAADTGGGGSIVRRNRPGTKAKDMYNWPDQDFNDMETVLAGMKGRL